MSSSYTPSLGFENPSPGSQTDSWGTTENTGRTLTDQAIAGWLTLDCSAGGTITLTSTTGASNQARNAMIKLTGTLPSNTTVVIPNVSKLYVIEDGTTRAGFTLAVQTLGGSPLSLSNAISRWVKCDGSNNVTFAESGLTIPVPVASGGTGSTSAAGARTNLGLGTISTINSPVPVANGGTAATDAGTARTNLGLGTIATQAASNVTITGGSITGITDLALADGGTGASTAANARTNFGLGTMATQNANGVAITGGSISGVAGVLAGASQAQMEAASSTTVAATPAVVQYHPGIAKAWVKFAGSSGSVSASYNSGGVSRTNTGRYTWSFSDAFSSSNYVVFIAILNSGGSTWSAIIASQSSGSLTIETQQGGSPSFQDPTAVYVCAFGDQP